MIVLMPYINLLNLSWIIKCLFLRNMEPLNKNKTIIRSTTEKNLPISNPKLDLYNINAHTKFGENTLILSQVIDVTKFGEKSIDIYSSCCPETKIRLS